MADTSETTPRPSLLATVKKTQQDVTRRMLELLLGAFTLVTALAWNEAVKSLFAPGGVFGIATRWGPWAYALFITLAVFIATTMSKKYITPPCTTLCSTTDRAPSSPGWGDGGDTVPANEFGY